MQPTELTKEGELFFRQWLRSPQSMGSVIPSSRALGRGGRGARPPGSPASTSSSWAAAPGAITRA